MFLYSVRNWTCSWLAYSLMQEITCLAWRGKLWNCQGKLQQTVQANGPCVLNNKRYLNRGVENCARSVLVREHHSCLLENNKRYLNRGVENWTKSKSEEHAEALWKSQRRSLRKCRTWSLIPWLWRDVYKLWILKLNFKVSQHLTNIWTRNDNRETVSPEPVLHL